MAFVHKNFQDLAVRLIKKNGRAVFVRRNAEVPIDVAKPWLGVTASSTDKLTTAVFLDNSSKDLLLMIPGAADQRSIIEAEDFFNVFIAAKTLSIDILISDQIVDGTTVWEIKNVRLIQPGLTPVVWILKVQN